MRDPALSAAQLLTHRAAGEAAGNTWEALSRENSNHAFRVPTMRKNLHTYQIVITSRMD